MTSRAAATALVCVALLVACATKGAPKVEPQQPDATQSDASAPVPVVVPEVKIPPPRIALVLGGGAAKGFAHIGVIQVLEENGIEVDIIAGSSMGAYVGSLWAYGYNGPELERLARELEGRWAVWSLIDPVFPPRQGFLGGFRVKKRLMRSLAVTAQGQPA